VTTEQFCRDVSVLCPRLQGNIYQLDPGDVLSLHGPEVAVHPDASSFVRKIGGDREELDFSPVTIGGDLVDHGLPDARPESVEEAVRDQVETRLLGFIRDNPVLFAEHYRWKVVYQLTVVFTEGVERWCFDFSKTTVQMRRGRDPLANLFTFVTGSSLYGLLEGTRGWDYAMIGGYYRRFSKIYTVTGFGLVRPESGLIVDPLELQFPYRQILSAFLLREVERWRQEGAASSRSEVLRSTA
jgi:hypothetical protein